MLHKKISFLALISCASVSFAQDENTKASEQNKAVATTSEPAQNSAQDKTIATTMDEILKDQEFVVKTLSDEHSDIDALSPSGKTCLQILMNYFVNNIDTRDAIAQTLKRGADVNKANENEKTPLYILVTYTLFPDTFAQYQKETDAALNKQLTENKTPESAETDVQNKEAAPATPAVQRNPIHDRAVCLELIDLLASFQADPLRTDSDGISPVLLAGAMEDLDILGIFAQYGLFEKMLGDENLQSITFSETSRVIIQA